MRTVRNELTVGRRASWAALVVLVLMLGGCGTSNLLGSSSNFFGSQKATTGTSASDAGGTNVEASNDVECPDVTVRTGAATLMIGDPSSKSEPSVLDLRYQGTIIRTARECHVNAGVMTMKVGIESRIITGPAGGPGTIDVPLRIAVVHEGPVPKTVVSKFSVIPVTMSSADGRVTFTHVEPDIAFPMPVPAADIDSYVVYVGFDPQGAPERKKPAPKRKPRTTAKPKQA